MDVKRKVYPQSHVKPHWINLPQYNTPALNCCWLQLSVRRMANAQWIANNYLLLENAKRWEIRVTVHIWWTLFSTLDGRTAGGHSFFGTASDCNYTFSLCWINAFVCSTWKAFCRCSFGPRAHQPSVHVCWKHKYMLFTKRIKNCPLPHVSILVCFECPAR